MNISTKFLKVFSILLVLVLLFQPLQVRANSGAWSSTGDLLLARYSFRATNLPNGQVLATGGFAPGSYTSESEVFDPNSGKWTQTGNMRSGRGEHTATLLEDGTVLVAGGYSGPILSSAEIYNPAIGTFTSTGNMRIGRTRHAATRLTNGKVLVTGGWAGVVYKSSELYDPVSKIWSFTGNMAVERTNHTSILLNNGKVLVAGGEPSGGVPLSSAELYDPTTGTWSITGSMNSPRSLAGAVRLQNGKVLVLGGWTIRGGGQTNTAELYDPTTGTWSLITNMSSAHTFPVGQEPILLTDGSVIVVGGDSNGTSEIYLPLENVWTSPINMGKTRNGAATVLLPSGKVLVAGGHEVTSPDLKLVSTQIFGLIKGLDSVADYKQQIGSKNCGDPNAIHDPVWECDPYDWDIVNGVKVARNGNPKYTIASSGCYITSMVNVMRYWDVNTAVNGLEVNPRTFNDYLSDELTNSNGDKISGYDGSSNYLTGIDKFSDGKVTLIPFIPKAGQTKEAAIDEQLTAQQPIPVIVGVPMQGTLLFTASLSYQNDLNIGTLSPEFRQEFTSKQIILSPNDQIIIRKIKDYQWWLTDNLANQKFIINNNGGLLKIYRRNSNGHWVTIVGLRVNGHYPIHDPGGYNATNLEAYGDEIGAMKLVKPTDGYQPKILIVAHSPVELLVTDGANRRTGYDSVTQTFLREIPQAVYTIEDPIVDQETGSLIGESKKVLYLPLPESGTYTLTLIGIGDGEFSIDFQTLDAQGNFFTQSTQGMASIGSVTTYLYNYDGETISLINQPPTVSSEETFNTVEGGQITLSAMGYDPEGDLLTYDWDLDNDGTFETPGQNVTFSAADLDGPDSRIIALRVTDSGGLSATDQAVVNILNVSPTADFVNDTGNINEGGTAAFAFNYPYDPGSADTTAGFLYSFDCTSDGIFEISDTTESMYVCSYVDNSVFTAHGRIKDKDTGYSDYTASVTVTNIPPMIEEIAAPLEPVQVNGIINTSASFVDPGALDTHTAVWDWGDGSTSAASVSEMNGSGFASGSHSYTTPGVYTLGLTITDKDIGVSTSTYQYLVVYDPNGGFVTGGGWIVSPEGAYTVNSTLTGRANFGFVAKYQKGATNPIGNTEFQFKVADLNFNSDAYEWLVVSGARAKFKGEGSINGEGNYKFMLTAIDGQTIGGGGTDKFRIKIWWEESDGTVHIVYDNQLGLSDDGNPTSVIQGGSIVVHKIK